MKLEVSSLLFSSHTFSQHEVKMKRISAKKKDKKVGNILVKHPLDGDTCRNKMVSYFFSFFLFFLVIIFSCFEGIFRAD